MSNDPRNIFVDQRLGNDKASSDTSAKQAYDKMDVEDKKKMLTELVSKYQREGEGQLVQDILTTVIEQKATGQLNNDQLKQFASRILPMLNGEQKQRLQQLLDQLLQL